MEGCGRSIHLWASFCLTKKNWNTTRVSGELARWADDIPRAGLTILTRRMVCMRYHEFSQWRLVYRLTWTMMSPLLMSIFNVNPSSPQRKSRIPPKKTSNFGPVLNWGGETLCCVGFQRQKKRAKRQTTAKGWYVSKASTLHIITMHYICITIFAWTSRICEGFNVKNVLHICQIGAPELILGCTSAFTRLSCCDFLLDRFI